MNPNSLNILLLKDEFILDQLHLEEALLRAGSGNFCVINRGSPPAIVMGLSAKVSELVNLEKIKSAPLPIIKRFSGGGTVVVDENTLFITFIMNRELLNIALQPEVIMKWTESLYKEVFLSSHFQLRENDYVFQEKKFGGNAQYLRKDRFLHHTSFLWDFDQEKMDYLLHPAKTPTYREGRSHSDFLCKMKDYEPSKENFLDRVLKTLQLQFQINFVKKEMLENLLLKPHRKTTEQINPPKGA